MEEQKVIYVRINKSMHKAFQKYAIDHDSNMNAVIEALIQALIETKIDPQKAIAAIRQLAKERPGDS